jgi:hypothetical protein
MSPDFYNNTISPQAARVYGFGIIAVTLILLSVVASFV